jgi:hypothetical protein
VSRKPAVPLSLLLLIAVPGLCCAQTSGRIQGKVLAADTAKPLANVGVGIYTADVTPLHPFTTRTDNEGEFVVRSIPTGRYLLTFVPPTGSNYVSEQIDLLSASRGDALEVDVKAGGTVTVTKKLRLGGELLLRTTRLDGTEWDALEEMNIRTSIVNVLPDGGRRLIEGNGTRSLVPGEIVVPGLPPTSTLEATLEPSGYRTLVFKSIEISSGQRTTLTVIVDPNDPTGIDGFVPPDSRVSVRRESADEVTGSARADAEGRFSIVGLLPGLYRVSVDTDEIQVVVVQGRKTTIERRSRRQAALDIFIDLFELPVVMAQGPPPREQIIEACGGRPLDPGTRRKVEEALSKVRDRLQREDCLGPRCKRRIIPKLFKTGFDIPFITPGAFRIIVGCKAPRNCASQPILTNVIHLLNDPFHPDELKACGCIESTLLHEMTHFAGFGECDAHRCAKQCFDCAQPVEKSYTRKTTMGGQEITEVCEATTPLCCDERCR